mmetsp:Transcript_42592/g.92955  ORF Transcript_42592/g.92955 Transcript_42592/m.92955 type:complete len:112 (-) Transcript_42592:49-384(-)
MLTCGSDSRQVCAPLAESFVFFPRFLVARDANTAGAVALLPLCGVLLLLRFSQHVFCCSAISFSLLFLVRGFPVTDALLPCCLNLHFCSSSFGYGCPLYLGQVACGFSLVG